MKIKSLIALAPLCATLALTVCGCSSDIPVTGVQDDARAMYQTDEARERDSRFPSATWTPEATWTPSPTWTPDAPRRAFSGSTLTAPVFVPRSFSTSRRAVTPSPRVTSPAMSLPRVELAPSSRVSSPSPVEAVPYHKSEGYKGVELAPKPQAPAPSSVTSSSVTSSSPSSSSPPRGITSSLAPARSFSSSPSSSTTSSSSSYTRSSSPSSSSSTYTSPSRSSSYSSSYSSRSSSSFGGSSSSSSSSSRRR